MEGCLMGQVLHGSATTTEATRRAIQNSQESLRALSKRYGINKKTVAKWKKRTSTSDLKTGPQEPKSTILSIEDEAIIVAFRRHTLLPLDDSLYALQPTLPHLTRSSLFTVACNVMVSADCSMLKATRRQGRNSNLTLLATSTLILPKYERLKENSTCSLRLTGLRSLLLLNCMPKHQHGWQQSS